MNTQISSLGIPSYPSPLALSRIKGDLISDFITMEARITVSAYLHDWKSYCQSGQEPPSFELAGPRPMIFFNPSNVRAAIVTCGGLCPGLNDVIRGVVMVLYHQYGVQEIFGIRYGFRGMTMRYAGTNIPLTPEIVSDIHTRGGTFLGSSRGNQEAVEMADFLQRRGIQMLFAVGGDGTTRGAMAIAEECRKRDYPVSVIGIPKTIDNDIAFIDRSFGFITAVAKAKEILDCAHVEAQGAPNGIALVKLMGRHSGYIAARASLASGDVNFVLIPEQPFDLDGDNGFLKHLEHRIERRGHALVVIAEGSGQEHLKESADQLGTDASGNRRLADIGTFMKQRIADYFESKSIGINIRYFDPSYEIRSAQASAEDSVFCSELAHNAVHAAFAGRTNMLVGTCNNYFVHIPMALAVSQRKVLDPDGMEWLSVVQSTGQPLRMING